MQAAAIKLAAVLGLLGMGACGWFPGSSSSVVVGFATDEESSQLHPNDTGGAPSSISAGVLVWREGRAPMLTGPLQVPGEERSLAYLVVIDPPLKGVQIPGAVGVTGSVRRAGESSSTAYGYPRTGAGRVQSFQVGDLSFRNEVKLTREADSEDPWQLEVMLEIGTHPGLPPVDLGFDIEKGRVFYVNSSEVNPVLRQLDIELPRGFGEDLTPDEYYALLEPVLAQLP